MSPSTPPVGAAVPEAESDRTFTAAMEDARLALASMQKAFQQL